MSWWSQPKHARNKFRGLPRRRSRAADATQTEIETRIWIGGLNLKDWMTGQRYTLNRVGELYLYAISIATVYMRA